MTAKLLHHFEKSLAVDFGERANYALPKIKISLSNEKVSKLDVRNLNTKI